MEEISRSEGVGCWRAPGCFQALSVHATLPALPQFQCVHQSEGTLKFILQQFLYLISSFLLILGRPQGWGSGGVYKLLIAWFFW